MPPVRRLAQLARMWRNGRRYGVRFYRRATFRPPQYLTVRGKKIELRFPQEEGVKWDFLGALLEDAYGLVPIKTKLSRIIDVGGNVGFFSIAARVRFPDAVVHAYEPNPGIASYIDFQSRSFGFSYFPEAVGGSAGQVSMDFSAGPDSNLGRAIETQDAGIRKISLDEAVKRIGPRVDLLKLDCEGAEWEMLRESKCWPLIDRLSMEYHLFHGETHEMMIEQIKKIGFRMSLHQFDPNGHYGQLWAMNPATIRQWSGR